MFSASTDAGVEARLELDREAFRNEWRRSLEAARANSLLSIGNRSSSATQNPAAASEEVLLFELASQAESAGRLDEAVKLYRSAYQLDSRIERTHHQYITDNPELDLDFGRLTLKKKSSGPKVKVDKRTQGEVKIQSILQSLLKPVDDVRLPENVNRLLQFKDSRPCPILKLPDEIILAVLHTLASQSDFRTLEHLASSASKFRLMTVGASIWKTMVQLFMKCPNQHALFIKDTRNRYDLLQDTSLRIARSIYNNHWRMMFIKHPRIRLDGCYVSRSRYSRQGISTETMYNTSFSVEYNRYLRFYEDGVVLSYQTSTEPAAILPKLDRFWKAKHLYSGRWRLFTDHSLAPRGPDFAKYLPESEDIIPQDTVIISDLTRASELRKGAQSSGHTFAMSLSLHSTFPERMHDRLHMLRYINTVDKPGGDAYRCDIPLRNESDFEFKSDHHFME